MDSFISGKRGTGNREEKRGSYILDGLPAAENPSSLHLSDDDEIAAQHRLLVTLERLLAIDAVDLQAALTEASNLVADALQADKVDVFLYDPHLDALIAMGISQTPLGEQQVALGLNCVSLAGGGRTVRVFQEQQPYITGRSDLDPDQLDAVINSLGIRSLAVVPLYVAGQLRGVVEAGAVEIDAFSLFSLNFLQAVAGWVSTIMHRAELIEKIRQDVREETRQTTADELLTTIAHDLRNYLTPLLGRADLIRRRAEREDREIDIADAEKMHSVIRRMDRMINDLVDVGRLEQGLFSVVKKPFELTSLFRDLAADFGGGRVSIQVIAPKTLLIQGDPHRLRQALENLLANALKHSPPDTTVTVSVAVEQRDSAEWTVLRVADKGPGISSEMIPRIFQRFAAGPESGGLGLGLYLAQGIAKAHAGTLSVESRLGEGACFILALPGGPMDFLN